MYGAEDGVLAGEVREGSGHVGDLNYLITMYLRGPQDTTLRSPFPAGCKLEEVRSGGNTLCIVLGSEFTALENTELTLACAALAKTCLALSHTQRVRIDSSSDEKTFTVTLTEDSLLLAYYSAFEAAPAEEAAPIPTAEYEALKLKAEQYDRMSAHIGAIMLKANAGAEDILSRAKTDADAMVAEVNGALAETRTRAQTAADTLIADVGRSLGEISRSCREDIAMDLEELRTALRTLEDTVSSKYADISRKLDYAKEEMEQTSGAIIRAATEPAAPVTGN